MAGKSVALDPGSHTCKVVALKDGKSGLELTAFAAFPAKDKAQGLADTGIPLKGVVAGVAGRDMTLRYTQVPPAPDWQLRNLMDLEISELSSQSGDELSADYNLLSAGDEDAEGETVLMALARNEALDRVSDMVQAAGGSIRAHVPNCIAIYNAYLRTFTTDEDQVVCIANIGHETVDIALAKGQDLLFARNLSGGGKVLDESISAAFNVSQRKAEQLKKELLDLDPASRGKFASGQAEKVTVAAGGSASMLVSAIQSSLAFCKAQTKQPDLQLDLILVCGGSARLRGIRGLLREALRCPVDVFDPFATVDLTSLTPAELEDLDAHRSEAVVALGLAATVLDDSLYSLEILPESVKKRQRFASQTIYNIGAALILVAVLALTAMTGARNAESYENQKRTRNRQVNRINRIDRQAADIIRGNLVKRNLIDELVKRSVPLDGTLHVMRALQSMPPELWLETVQVIGRKDRGRNQKFGVTVKGQGKSVAGDPITSIFSRYYTRLSQDESVGDVKQEVFKVGETKNTLEFELFFDLVPPPPPPAKGDDKEGE